MLPKKGTVFPGQSDRRKARLEYASLVAQAMRSELGGTHQAIKTVMRWTGAGERTVKNWFNAEKGPSGVYLLRLVHESDDVLYAFLRAAGRADFLSGVGPGVGDDGRRPISSSHDKKSSAKAAFSSGTGKRPESRSDDPDHDPDHDPDRDPENTHRGPALNERQRWFLDQLGRGSHVKTADIMKRWAVAEKTAKRDVSGLKLLGLIDFVGSARTGSYRPAIR